MHCMCMCIPEGIREQLWHLCKSTTRAEDHLVVTDQYHQPIYDGYYARKHECVGLLEGDETHTPFLPLWLSLCIYRTCFSSCGTVTWHMACETWDDDKREGRVYCCRCGVWERRNEFDKLATLETRQSNDRAIPLDLYFFLARLQHDTGDSHSYLAHECRDTHSHKSSSDPALDPIRLVVLTVCWAAPPFYSKKNFIPHKLPFTTHFFI